MGVLEGIDNGSRLIYQQWLQFVAKTTFGMLYRYEFVSFTKYALTRISYWNRGRTFKSLSAPMLAHAYLHALSEKGLADKRVMQIARLIKDSGSRAQHRIFVREVALGVVAFGKDEAYLALTALRREGFDVKESHLLSVAALEIAQQHPHRSDERSTSRLGKALDRGPRLKRARRFAQARKEQLAVSGRR